VSAGGPPLPADRGPTRAAPRRPAYNHRLQRSC